MSSLELKRHNQTVFDNLEPGDRLQFERGLYDHWAVYIGNSQFLKCVDDQGASDQNYSFAISGVEFGKGIVRIDKFWPVAGESKVHINNSKDTKIKPYEPHRIVQRALSRVGEVGYNIFYKNCEHFASWCRYDKEESDQVDGFWTALAVGGGVALAGLVVWLGSGGEKQRKRQSEY
ncbi:phospholipase A and acyltransferase 3-like [Haliotis asinina]|uniref:phospholipase A and acyltransferase 3-like n=1 Tax=Haliotis asinina TaxID=109174 RepID=UPI00353214DE